jgi:hypothetical protein
VLIVESKSVTLGNRVAVKGTVEEGIEELFCEGRAPFDFPRIFFFSANNCEKFRNKIAVHRFKLMTKQFVLSFYIGARDPHPLPEALGLTFLWRDFFPRQFQYLNNTRMPGRAFDSSSSYLPQLIES